MKFGKEFALQMVSEWQDAYMDYACLKTILKDVKSFMEKNKPAAKNFSLHRTFSGLTHLHRHGHGHGQDGHGKAHSHDQDGHGHVHSHDGHSHVHVHPINPERIVDIEEQPVLMNSMQVDGSESYTTTLLRSREEFEECELVFFKRLDDEFSKVISFYKSKVEEVMKDALDLNKQMDALIAFRIKVENNGNGDITCLPSTASLWSSFPSRSKEKGRIIKDVAEESGSSRGGSSRGRISEESNEEEEEDDKENHDNMMMRQSSLEILNKVKLNPTLHTPSTIKVILNAPNLMELKFNRENLKKVEQKLRRAFIEFYHKLLLLRSYSFLNMLAFSKIMKKFDKITSRNASKEYMNMIDNSCLGSSDEVSRLMGRVEDTFVKHFTNSNRRKGMHILRPKDKKERHIISFCTGFFGGCTAALIVALTLIIRDCNIGQDHNGRADYMDNMFPLYSLFGFIILHMLMYAANIYFWRRYRVNYSFIFGFKKGTELGYREVLLLSFGFSVLALVSVISNLDMEMDPKTNDYIEFTELLPLGLVILVVLILLCPFNIIYRSSRYFFLVSAFRSLVAPLCKVTLPDFFMADQMTSQAQAFRSLEFYICYYGWGDYKHRRNTCKSNSVFNAFYIIVAAFPFWIRFLQCVRRLCEEKDSIHTYNGLKYFLTVVAVCLRTVYSINKGIWWKVVAWIFSAIAGAFCAYWDLYYDWGVLQRNSKNKWLRDKLLIPHKSVYFVAMVLDVLLRFAWLETVLDFRVSLLHQETLIAIFASLEIIRRGVWNFFRLENEHLNNVGRYRAFKSVPLPFNYHEDEEDEDE